MYNCIKLTFSPLLFIFHACSDQWIVFSELPQLTFSSLEQDENLAALASNILGNYEGNHCVWLPYEQHFYWRGRTLKIFTFLLMFRLQAHWILMSSSSRLVLEVRSHIIMSSNFTLLLVLSYAFSVKRNWKRGLYARIFFYRLQ